MIATTISNVSLGTILGCLAILAIIIVCIIVYHKKANKSADAEQELKDFLAGLENVIYNAMAGMIEDADYSKYTSVADMETSLLNTFYDEVTPYIITEVEDISDPVVATIIKKLLNKEVIEDYINKIIETHDLKTKADNNYAAATIAKTSSQVAEEDKELEEEYSDQSKYVEEDDGKLPSGEDEIEIDESKPINPPRDEEEPYDPTDEGMELVNEDGLTKEEVEAGVHFNKAGRKVDKRGRFVK